MSFLDFDKNKDGRVSREEFISEITKKWMI